jgi:hypothetical protein
MLRERESDSTHSTQYKSHMIRALMIVILVQVDTSSSTSTVEKTRTVAGK